MANSSADLFGNYPPQTEPGYIETPLDGLSKLAQKTQYASGCSNPKCAKYDKAGVTEALKMADFIVVCLGTGWYYVYQVCRLNNCEDVSFDEKMFCWYQSVKTPSELLF